MVFNTSILYLTVNPSHSRLITRSITVGEDTLPSLDGVQANAPASWFGIIKSNRNANPITAKWEYNAVVMTLARNLEST